jgi:hypothetical protein
MFMLAVVAAAVAAVSLFRCFDSRRGSISRLFSLVLTSSSLLLARPALAVIVCETDAPPCPTCQSRACIGNNTWGSCAANAKFNGLSCNDNNACTHNDVCQSGACVGTPVVCQASLPCHVAGTCDTSTGLCSNPPVPDTPPTSCDDQKSYTSHEACIAGACTAGAFCDHATPTTCPMDRCHPAAACDANIGSCTPGICPGAITGTMTRLDSTPFTLSAITTNPVSDAPAAVSSYSFPVQDGPYAVISAVVPGYSVLYRVDGGAWTPGPSVSVVVSGTGTRNVSFEYGAVATLTVSGTTSVVAGGATSYLVTAKDSGGNVAIGYRGTVHFTATGTTNVPPDYTFTASDNGVKTFTPTSTPPTGSVVLFTAGTQTLTVKDNATATIAGTATVTVTGAAAASLIWSGAPASATACAAFNLTVDAKDTYGNQATSYTGPVHFTSSDAQAALPVDSALTAGHAVFSVTLHTAGSPSVTIANSAGGIAPATTPGISVSACAVAKLKFASASGSPRTACSLDSPTLTAQDAWSNTVASYRGTVAMTSGDTFAVLPAAYAFTAADNGVHTFGNAVRLPTVATSSVTASDTSNGAINGVESSIVVNTCTVTCGGNGICVPNAPGAMSSTATSSMDGNFTLSWGASTSGSPDHYELWEGSAVIYSGAATAFTPPTRADNSVYAYKARGCNSNGCGDFNIAIAVSVLYRPGVPGPISVPAESGSSYVVTWASGSGVTSYYVLEESTSAGVWASFPATAELPPPTSMAFANKAANTYSYRVNACNASGCSVNPSAVASTQVVPPNLSAIADDALSAPAAPANQAVGTIPGSPGVEGGTATYSIPIEIPPGRAGMQPSLALSYSSKGSLSELGVGWTLSGTSSIYACPNTLAQEGANRPVLHDGLDKLCYEGQRLLVTSGAYGAAGSQYRTEIESFDRITLLGASMGAAGSYFQVEHKSGHISQYEPAPTHSGASADSYHLRREFDPQGNCVSYKYNAYTRFNGDVQWVLDTAVYTSTGSGTTCSDDTAADASLRSVHFTYDNPLALSNPNVLSPVFRSTYGYSQPGQVTLVLLTGITTNVGSTPVRHYELDYGPSAATSRPLLSQVTVCAGAACGGGAFQLPPTTFTYQQATTNFVPWHAQIGTDPPLGLTWSSLPVGDLDGDGINELLFTSDSDARTLQLSSCGATPVVTSDQSLGFQTTIDFINQGSIDFDFDGRVDVLSLSASNTLQLNDLRCNGAPTVIDTTLSMTAVSPSGPGLFGGAYGGIDYDGDGIADVMYTDMAFVTHVALRKDKDPTHWATAKTFIVPPPPAGFMTTMTQDMNGDGTMDMVFEDGRLPGKFTDILWFFQGLDGTGQPIYASWALDQLGGPAGPWSNAPKRRWIDVNGDGLPDIFDPDAGGLWINKGGIPGPSMFEFHPVVGFNEIWQRSETSFTMDVDNDGRQELMVPSYRTRDFCGGNPHATISNAFFNADPAFFCGSEYDQEGIPTQWIKTDQSVFAWNAYRFVEETAARTVGGPTTFVAQMFPTTLQAPAHMQLLQSDVNGTGNTSVHYRLLNLTYQWAQTTYQNYYPGLSTAALGPYIAVNQTPAPDLLISATNGLGAEAKWSHRPLTDISLGNIPMVNWNLTSTSATICDMPERFYTAHLDDSQNPGYSFFTSSMWVVNRFDVSNGVAGGTNKTCYRYQDGMLNSEGRGFQGFKQIVEEQQFPAALGEDTTGAAAGCGGTCSINNLRTTLQFYQEFPLTSRPKSETVAKVSGATLSATTHYWNVQQSSVGQPWLVFPVGSEAVKYENSTTPGAFEREGVTTSISQIDPTSGEASRSCAVTAGSGTQTGYLQVNTRTLTNDTVNCWWLGRDDGDTVASDTFAFDLANYPASSPLHGTQHGQRRPDA